MTFQIHPYYTSWKKKLFDRVLASTLLILLSPLFIVISLGILIENGAPVLFLQKRTGKKGKPFQVYKFRTMIPLAEQWKPFLQKWNESVPPMFKMHHDPRFTAFGKILSLTGLDEIPQLINIIRGEMSFVGPRPLPIEESHRLDSSWQYRFEVLPGIFSEWALSPQKHASQSHWQNLEKKTLQNGGILYDLKLTSRYFVNLTRHIIAKLLASLR